MFFRTTPFVSVRRSCCYLLVLGLLPALLGGCAGRLDRAVSSYYSGQPEKAGQLLTEPGLRDRYSKLLFLVERATILHDQGDYRQSIDLFLEADRLIEDYEKISLSEQSFSLVTNEWLTSYRGEYSERLWVHTYLMMNFLLLGEYDGALVEAKRALERLQEDPQVLRQAFFTRALMALSFANLGEDNDALLLYRQLADDLADRRAVSADIVFHARRLGMLDVVDSFSGSVLHERAEGEGELVLFVSSGRIPHKLPGNIVVPPSIRFSFPYYASSSKSLNPWLQPSSGTVLSQISSDLGSVARASLDARKGRILAKQSARAVAKEAMAQAVGNSNDAGAEIITRVFLFLLEEADVRSWRTLPGQLSLIRIALPARRHQIHIETGVGRPSIVIPEFTLRPGQRHFYALRLK